MNTTDGVGMDDMTSEQLFDMASVVFDVEQERYRQHAKWGEQNHPFVTGAIRKEHAGNARESTDRAARDGSITWEHILLEEVFELLAARELDDIYEEAVQVSAVAAAIAENVLRKRARVGAK